MKKYFALTIIAASISLAACSDDDDDDGGDTGVEMPIDPTPVVTLPDVTPDGGNTVYDTIAGSPNHTTLLAAIQSITDLDRTLDNPASFFTVFAPTDAAFQALADADPDDAITAPTDLLTDENEALLTRVLQGHVIPSLVPSGSVAELATTGQTTETLAAGAPLTFAVTSTEPPATSGFDVLGAPVGDVPATPIALNDIDLGADAAQGVVHSIDTVIAVPAAPEVETPETPETPENPETPPVAGGDGTADVALAATGTNEIFRNAVLSIFGPGQVFDTNPWTFFAPTDAALAAAGVTSLTAEQLQAHISTNSGLAPADLQGTVNASDNSVLTFGTDSDGNPTVNGNTATFIGAGDAGGQIYSIDAVLGN